MNYLTAGMITLLFLCYIVCLFFNHVKDCNSKTEQWAIESHNQCLASVFKSCTSEWEHPSQILKEEDQFTEIPQNMDKQLG